MDDNLITIVVLGFLGYELLSSRSPYAGIVPGQPYVTGGGASVIPGTNFVIPAGLQQAQAAINNQVAQQNQAITQGANAIATVAATVGGPVGAAVGAAIAVVGKLIAGLVSDTHLYANQLVQRYENPFGNAVIALIQEVTNQLNAGTLTLTDATAARNALVSGWQQYQATMQQIRSQSTDWFIVATQSLNNLDNQYLGTTLPNGKTLGAGMGGAYGDQLNYGFMSSWIDWLNGIVTSKGGV